MGGTRKVAIELDKIIARYLETMGKPMDPINTGIALRGVMDETTARDAKLWKIPQDNNTLRKLIEEMYHLEGDASKRRKPGKGKKEKGRKAYHPGKDKPKNNALVNKVYGKTGIGAKV